MKHKSIRITTFFSMLLLVISPDLYPQSGDTISFIHITDTHVCNLNGYHPFFAKSRDHFSQGASPFVDFMKAAPQKMDFVVITGDMTDYFEAETTTGNMLDTEVEKFARHLESSAATPVYMTLGNHDIATYWVDSEKSYASNQLNAERARASWTRNLYCFKDGTYYSRVYQAGGQTYRLIFLDNAYYDPELSKMSSKVRKEKEPVPYVIDDFQLFWLESQLKESDKDHEILFMHMPLLGGIDRPSGSVVEKNTLKSTCGIYDLLEKYPSVKMIVSGHKHRNVIHNFKFPGGHVVTQVETGLFAGHPENQRTFRLTAGGIIVSGSGIDGAGFTIPSGAD